MKVVVQDASVLIDLADAGILDAWFSVGIETLTTGLAWREVNRRSQKSRIRKIREVNGLEVVKTSAETMTEIVALKQALPSAISLQDVSVLQLAEARGAILLAGDELLRKCAKARSIEVRGMLWVLDELIVRETLSPSGAADALERLLRGNARLPREECDQRLRRWRTK